jgi:hypothetical protein
MASGADLRAQLRELVIESTLLEAQIESRAETRKRTFRLIRGTALNVAGFALAEPTGGWSVLVCAVGLWDWADALGEDARIMNQQIAIRRRVDELKRRLDDIQSELDQSEE